MQYKSAVDRGTIGVMDNSADETKGCDHTRDSPNVKECEPKVAQKLLWSSPDTRAKDATTTTTTTTASNSPSVTDASLECVVNPPVPSELGEAECAMLRGDAIGTTAYTHRWVLNTLLTVTKGLPQYLIPEEKPSENNTSIRPATEDDSQTPEAGKSRTSRGGVIELGEEVENAACQLWDMSAEPDVVGFLIKLEAVDVLQLANDIITLSRAPRLTEVIVGVVANLCCQGEGCERVVGCSSLLQSCLALFHSTDDVPTLVEAFRLLRLLLWHVTFRLPPKERSRSSLVIALRSNEALKEALVFMLKNSLSDTLLNSLLEFLESLMYLWLPEEQCYMAAQYSESGLVEGVVEVMRHFLKAYEKNGRGEQPPAVQRGLLILYSFVSTPAVQIISSFDQYEPLLEPILVSYVEHLAKTEDVSELTEGDVPDQMVYALGLCELLVPTMRNTSILLAIGKLLALTHGASHHYTHLGQSKDVVEKVQKHKSDRSRRRSKRSSRSTSSQEDTMDTDSQDHCSRLSRTFSKPEEMEGAEINCQGEKETTASDMETRKIHKSRLSAANEETKLLERDVTSKPDCSDSSSPAVLQETKKEKDTSTKLNNMIESLVDYCVRVVRCCPDLCDVFTTLNECHVHEVQLFFKAVKSREPTLVGQLQEQLLDTGSHNRLVTILSDMYS
ncbi:hypothetical protein Pmani_022310 [Petrolisthes manimaculis]|uniref:Uncharacterized protein n=1 Tax=Petrolisthes manimaculis TaxID=1843537 RepID=A0AAE1PE48_9EUCA|nr:hypothetical protein Pmani_022310 [Petrolisthes manimaculis]